MKSVTKTRFKTGEKSPAHSGYHFDGYLNGSTEPLPTAEEMAIELQPHEKFPPIRSVSKGCWWKLVK